MTTRLGEMTRETHTWTEKEIDSEKERARER